MFLLGQERLVGAQEKVKAAKIEKALFPTFIQTQWSSGATIVTRSLEPCRPN